MKRSKWKGPFVQKIDMKNKKLSVFPRNFEVTLHLVGRVVTVYSGNKFVNITLSEEMIGYKLGEFVPTREKFVFKKKKKK